MNESFYALFTCDQWKSYSSMNLIGVFDRTHLNDIILNKVKEEIFELDDSVKLSQGGIQQASIRDIDVALTYGFVQSLTINEEL